MRSSCICGGFSSNGYWAAATIWPESHKEKWEGGFLQQKLFQKNALPLSICIVQQSNRHACPRVTASYKQTTSLNYPLTVKVAASSNKHSCSAFDNYIRTLLQNRNATTISFTCPSNSYPPTFLLDKNTTTTPPLPALPVTRLSSNVTCLPSLAGRDN